MSIGHKIAQATSAMDQVQTVITEGEKFEAKLEELRARVGHLSTAPVAANLPPADGPTECKTCYNGKKNRVFIKCGHQVCAECADKAMQGDKKCFTCRRDILDVLQLF